MILNRIKKASIDLLPDGTHADGGNLYLRKKGSARSWVFRYRFHYKTFELGLGSAWATPIADARKKAAELRVKIANGECPSIQAREKRVEKAQAVAKAAANSLTLCQIVEEALEHKVQVKEIRTRRYVPQCLHEFNKFIASPIGHKPIVQITPAEVAAIIRPIAKKNAGVNCLSILRACYSYAAAVKGYRGANPTDWKSGLNMLLPRVDNSQSATPLYSLDWREIPALYKRLSEQEQTSMIRALRILVLSPFRCNELFTALSKNLDVGAATLTLETTKTSRTSVVMPLSKQALDLMCPIGAKYVIEKDKQNGVRIAHRTTLDVLKRISGNPAMTLHGFRSSFSTWCAENGKDPATRERCLGHVVDTKVALAYQRSDLLDQRRALLQEWADYVTSSVAPQ